MLVNFKNSFIVLFFILLSIDVSAQYTPFFQNYSLTDFNAGNQNWDISFAETGKLYVANDKGLLEFDGIKWNFYQLPNKTIIRSVLVKDSLIYTGSYKEFGYWEKTKKGILNYTSLSDFDEVKESLDEEFWQILPYNDAILFRSFSNLYVYKDDKIIKIKSKPTTTILSCNVVDNKVYVSTLKDGIYILQDETLVPLYNTDKLFNTKIVSITKFNNNLLITTALRGCFFYEDGELEILESQINSVIKEHQLNSFLILENKNMVFGTIKNGIYITNDLGEILFHISKENGLQNSTVLSLCVDKNNKLWAGLDNGLALIDLDYNHLLFNDNSGEVGAVYDIINYKNTLYVGSNTGLFYLDINDNKLKFIEGSQGQVWDLKEINGELFCGHNNGTYLVENRKIKEQISSFTGGWVIKKVPESDNIFVQGTYAGLVRYRYVQGEWHVKHLGATTIPAKFLVFEDSHTAWVAHAYKGLFKVKFDKDYENIIEVKNYINKGLWSDFNVRVHNIKNDICFKTNEGWQKYEALIDSIVPNDLLNAKFGKDTNIISDSNANLLVTKSKNDNISLISLSSGVPDFKIPKRLFQNRLVVDAESISQIEDSIFALNLYGGFMIINKASETKIAALQKPIIDQIEIDKSFVDINNLDSYEFPFNKNISISISAPNYSGHFFEYAFTSSGSETLNWYRMNNEKLELSSLSNGDYSIYFRTANFSGETSSEKILLRLKILPPWYKNGFLYFIAALLISLVFYWLHRRKVKKEQVALQDRLITEQEVLLKEKAIENDKKIGQLKNESLKNEVKLKSKQLANTAMSLVKKNESMLEIKNELVNSKVGFDNSIIYNRLLRKIDNSIGHEDEWQLFEYNFNQVHEDFFIQLKSKFPKLTHKDLKICAYIKMNLLTKEIAPLMNVSIRGLETHRYRLKRKLNLENDKSLIDFLQLFK